MINFLKAKKLLIDDITLVLVKGDQVITSEKRGISFLLSLACENKYQGYSAADKIVGKAAAFLYVIMQVENVYGETITKRAVEILRQANINVEYKILTENIINRTNTGLCPMELIVLNIEDKEEAFMALKKKINE
jgi:phosphopantetheine adenylyltransferase